MTTLIEDEELQKLRAMAEGKRDFEESLSLEQLAAKDWGEFKKLSARERLAVGYYQAAKSRNSRGQESGAVRR